MRRTICTFFLFGLLAALDASVIKKPIDSDDFSHNKKVADITARFEDKASDYFPELKNPSNEEWIELIDGSFESNELINGYNFSVQANSTGSFTDSSGANGKFVSRYLFSSISQESGTQRATAKLTSVSIGNASFEIGEVSQVLFTNVGKGQVVTGGVDRAKVYYVKNGTYDLLKETLGFSEGLIVPGTENGTLVWRLSEMCLANSSNFFTLSAVTANGNMKSSKNLYHYDGAVYGHKLPLTSSHVEGKSPNTVDDFIEMVVENSVNEFTIMGESFNGDYSEGSSGEFNFSSNAYTFKHGGDMYKWNTSLNGLYWPDKRSQDGVHFSLYDMLSSMTHQLF